MKRAFVVVFTFAWLFPLFCAAQEEVSFRVKFNAGAMGSSIIIQTTSSQSLKIEAGDYVLDGKSLIIHASKVVLEGNVTIRSFSIDSEAPLKAGVGPAKPQSGGVKPVGCNGESAPEGCDGSDGEPGSSGISPGNSGRRSGNVILNFDAFVSNGFTLNLIAEGQRGGQGQKGGTGQQGAQGIEGRGQGGLPKCEGPYRGGNGGVGGPSGAGGSGGEGGVGGRVLLSKVMKGMLDGQGGLAVLVGGGQAGKPGDPGEPGAGGGPGKTGSGNGSCSTNPPGPGLNGLSGSRAPVFETTLGAPGKSGAISLF
jgi:hypothetical protein